VDAANPVASSTVAVGVGAAVEVATGVGAWLPHAARASKVKTIVAARQAYLIRFLFYVKLG